MKRSVQETKVRVNELALLICRPLTGAERAEFFKSVPNLKPVYIKGKNKGKERVVYNVDGRGFNKLWALIYPYVHKSATRSVYANSENIEEAVSEIKILVLKYLRYFDPASFSQNLPLLVNNALTNWHNRTEKNIKAESIFRDDTSNDDFSCDVREDILVDYTANVDREYLEILNSVPECLREAVKRLSSGDPLPLVAKEMHVSAISLKRQLQSHLSYLKG